MKRGRLDAGGFVPPAYNACRAPVGVNHRPGEKTFPAGIPSRRPDHPPALRRPARSTQSLALIAVTDLMEGSDRSVGWKYLRCE